MWTIMAAALFIATVGAHEAGHWLAFHEAGIPVTQVGIGLPLPPRLILWRRGGAHEAGASPWRRARRGGVEVVLSPWLLGAYVTPAATPGQIDELPFRKLAWCAGAGVVVNLVAGAAFGAVCEAMRGDWLRTAVLSALAAVIWTARRFLPAVFPFLGIGIMVLLAVGLATEARNGQSGGITGTAAALVSHSAAGAVAIAALMSVAMAMLNMIPLHPLDSGRIMRAIIRSRLGQRAADRYGAFSTITCLVLVVVLPLLTDILHLLHWRL